MTRTSHYSSTTRVVSCLPVRRCKGAAAKAFFVLALCNGAAITWLGTIPVEAAEPNGTLAVEVYADDGGEQPAFCRAWVEAGGERYYQPRGGAIVPYDRDRSFSCSGQFSLDLPAGQVVIHVEKGKEYLPVDREVEIKPNETVRLRIDLKRWIDMKKRGWYSGDMHAHFCGRKLTGFPEAKDIAVMEQTARADDVNYTPFLSFWNHLSDFKKDDTPWPASWPVWPRGHISYADRDHLITLANSEIERIGGEPFHSVGALLILGMRNPLGLARHDQTYPCDAQLVRQARRDSPICVVDCDKPLWSENVVTAAFGLLTSAQLCHNHFHRAGKDIPVCCGMPGPITDEEKKRDWGDDEAFWRNNDIYYRWLNCGFRLAVTGGTAMGVMPSPLGYNRTYARVDGPLTEEKYLRALLNGRTFATSGPMLFLTVDGKEPGFMFRPIGEQVKKPLQVKAELLSIEPIDTLELVQNGQVIRQLDLKDTKPEPVLNATLEMILELKRSGWVAARALYKNPANGRLRQAHTSPIYFMLEGKPIAFKQDAEYMIRWVDRLLETSHEPNRYKNDVEREEIQDLYRQARRIYEDIATKAQKAYGD